MTNMQMMFFFTVVLFIIEAVMIVNGIFRIRRVKREDRMRVDAIVSYHRGDLEPWDPRFEAHHKTHKRHGYTFNNKYHEDPWDIDVSRN